jgi:hypothetical protein
LPKGYSFHVEPRSKKEQKTISMKKKIDEVPAPNYYETAMLKPLSKDKVEASTKKSKADLIN